MGLSATFVTITFSLVLYRLGLGTIRNVEWVPLETTSAADLLKTLPVMMILYVCHYNVHPVRRKRVCLQRC
jgi:amino acid permease